MIGLPVIIPTTKVGTPAALALTIEGIEVREVVMTDYYHYARLFTDLWQRRGGFILVEHDIVPWPGALRELEDCGREWCAFQYRTSPDSWCTSLGCMKFDTTLVARIEPDEGWQDRGWDALDGAVIATLEEEAVCHVHHPPVAHAKARSLALRYEE